MNGRSNRRKGHDFERLVVRLLTDSGVEAERNLEYQPGKSGHDVHFRTPDGRVRTVSCKAGNQVPVSVYSWLLNQWNPDGGWLHGDYVASTEGHRIWYIAFGPGNAWITKSIGDCDELWCKRSRDWPIVVIYR